jgi:membrane-bound lytic murein transglycosylase B
VFFPTELDSAAPAGLWQLEGADGDEYWVGFNNLYVITRYNRSVMYALAAWELGQSVVREAEQS